MKKIFLFALMLFCLSLFIVIPTQADSGWDSSYDSGGSWDSGSSSSSWGSGSDHDYSGSSSNSDFTDFIGFFSFVVLVISIIILIKQKNEQLTTNAIYSDVDDSILASFDLNIITLKQELFSKFKDIQNAWMEFDYDKLRELCTDELYNSYKSQLDVLKLKNGKNIMSDFELLDIKIFEVKEENSQLIVNVYMKVSFYDYVINTTNNSVVRGNADRKLTNNYVMTFVRSRANSDNIIHCPNCNAEVHVNASGECEYCGSVIVKDASQFVLSKKENINKR